MSECLGSAIAERAQNDRDAAADKTDSIETAHHLLLREFTQAMEAGNVALLIRTPGFGPNRLRATLDDVLCHAIADADVWRGLIALVVMASKCDDKAVQLTALAWIARVANDHAEYHADDLDLLEQNDDAAPPARVWRAK